MSDGCFVSMKVKVTYFFNWILKIHICSQFKILSFTHHPEILASLSASDRVLPPKSHKWWTFSLMYNQFKNDSKIDFSSDTSEISYAALQQRYSWHFFRVPWTTRQHQRDEIFGAFRSQCQPAWQVKHLILQFEKSSF